MSERKPWDQMPGESAGAYERFLTYRNLGTGRTLHAAYGASQTAKGRKVKAFPSGTWTSDQHRFKWFERCKAWDIYCLLEQGPAIAKDFLESVRVYANNLVDAIRQETAANKPLGFESITKALDLLSKVLPPGFIDAYLARLRNDLGRSVGDAKPSESGQ